jgi:hypothetical protein
MKTILYFLLVSLSLTTLAQYNKENLKLESQVKVNQFKFENLQLYPVRANQPFFQEHKNLGNYLTLEEALKQKKVEITEYSGGTVNTLYIENISRDTVMILSGEVVKGGKQDRVIAQDFILSPKSGKKDVSVFCVEHGRWQTQEGGDMSFREYYSISSNEVRKAATVKKDQSEVWKQVAETTKKNNASTSTGTLTALDKSGDLSKDLARYTTHFKNVFASQPDVIGVVVVTGDKILGCDMFATHDLFMKQYPNLLASYATEAITSGKTVSMSYEKVASYLDNIISNEYEQEKKVNDNGTMMRNGKKKVHISTFN